MINVNERSIEYAYVFNAINRYAPESFLDVGTGKVAMPSLVKACGIEITAIDFDESQIMDNPCTRGGYCSFNIIKENLLSTTITRKFDMITCISVLEHNRDYDLVVEKMSSMLSDKGVLVLTFPYNENEYIPNSYKLPNAGYGMNEPPTNICQMYSREQVNKWENEYNLKLDDQEFWQAFTGEYWTYGQRMWPPIKASKDSKHQLSCMSLKKK